ncbi:hypothetical protein AVP_93 [Aerococcus phage vB_AviM_AVP]|nr:hypothetical protein AVP_93 [Aerococcus phage vB_AviM_AVP]
MANMTWKTQEQIEKEEQAELNKRILEEQQRKLEQDRQRLIEKLLLEQVAKNGEL